MAQPSERLDRRIDQDFSPGDASEVRESLRGVPESLPLAEKQDPERLQAALVLAAHADVQVFRRLLEVARRDWRNLLMAAGLADGSWPAKLTEALGP